MEVAVPKNSKRAEHLLQSQRIQLHQIESFSFMEALPPRPCKRNLGSESQNTVPDIRFPPKGRKKDKVIYMPPFRHPFIARPLSGVARNPLCQLCSEGTEHGNSLRRKHYQRPSLYMFWFFIIPYVPDIGLLFHRGICMVGDSFRPSYRFGLSFFH